MKIAITVVNSDMEAALERRFGRCPYFLIVDTDTKVWKAHPNPAMHARGGAGPRAAQFLADQGVEVVVGGDFGPNAFTALEAAGIGMYSAENGQADTLLDEFLAGHLEQVRASTGKQLHGGRMG